MTKHQGQHDTSKCSECLIDWIENTSPEQKERENQALIEQMIASEQRSMRRHESRVA